MGNGVDNLGSFSLPLKKLSLWPLLFLNHRNFIIWIYFRYTMFKHINFTKQYLNRPAKYSENKIT